METIFKTIEMQALVERAKIAAKSDAPAFIAGENGSGKEHIAHILHNEGKRAKESFIAINCAALPSHLIESELFGSRRGSFTGSTEDKQGLFREAGSGTIFLDELAEMPIETQSKLLRVLQERRVRAVGSSTFFKIDCRVVAATNQNVDEAIKNQKLRMDLYYRLAVITLNIPALRERKDDIPVLANYFIKKFSEQEGKQVTVAPSLFDDLKQAKWQGNVRQLQNAVQRAIIFNQSGTLTAKDFMDDLSVKSDVNENSLDIEEAHKSYLIRALHKTNGHMDNAAKLLNVSRGTVYEWRKKFGLVDA